MFAENNLIIKGASDEQREIILSSGAISVSACPGSGKTWTASRLFVNRAKNKTNRYSGIALLSHTNIAVETFKNRILEIDASLDVDRINYVGTIDSFVEKYLISPFYYLFHKQERRPFFFGFDRDSITLSKYQANTQYPVCVNDIRCFIEDNGLIYKAKKNKNNNQYIDLPSSPVRELFIRTINNLARYTHDMRWFIVYEIIENTDVLRCLANRFSEIIIDEAQDTRELAYNFFDRLLSAASDTLHISLIGDINQSIYSFSGATPEIYIKYINKWGLKKYNLTVNRRSYSEVIRGVYSLFGIRMTSLINDEKSGIYFISESKYNEIRARQIATLFGSSPSSVCILSRHKSSTENRATLYLQKLFNACNKRNLENNPKAAYREIVNFIKVYGNFSLPDEDTVNRHIWEIVKNTNLLPPLDMTWKLWRPKIYNALNELAEKLGTDDLIQKRLRRPNLLEENQTIEDFLKTKTNTQTVHSVKGETFDGIIFIDEKFQWKKLVESGSETDVIADEELRIAYVAITRARKFALLVIPDKHLKNYENKWKNKIRELPINDYSFAGYFQ